MTYLTGLNVLVLRSLAVTTELRQPVSALSTVKIIAHDLLQAIARVNRTSGKKKCGYVVDYVGVGQAPEFQRQIISAAVDLGPQDLQIPHVLAPKPAQ